MVAKKTKAKIVAKTKKKVEKKAAPKGRRKNAVDPMDGQALLIQYFWKLHGGPKAVAEKLKVPLYQPQNWNKTGKVPAKYLEKVAKYFKVPKWGLNYKVAKLESDDKAPKWADVAKMYKLTDEQVKEVIKFGAP